MAGRSSYNPDNPAWNPASDQANQTALTNDAASPQATNASDDKNANEKKK